MGRVVGSGVGAKYQVQCEEGYKLKGPSIRSCMEDGTWSDFDSTTACEGNFIFFENFTSFFLHIYIVVTEFFLFLSIFMINR